MQEPYGRFLPHDCLAFDRKWLFVELHQTPNRRLGQQTERRSKAEESKFVERRLRLPDRSCNVLSLSREVRFSLWGSLLTILKQLLQRPIRHRQVPSGMR